MRVGLAGVLALLLGSQALCQTGGCLGEVVITDPVCGENFIDRPSITIRGVVTSGSGTLALTVSSTSTPVLIPINALPGPCPMTPFEITVPLNCGCTLISGQIQENPSIRTRQAIHVHQGPPAAFVRLFDRLVRIGGCSPSEFDNCLGVTCPGSSTVPGLGGGPGTTAECGGGSATCYTTSVITLSGSVPTADSTLTVIGPLNTVVAVNETTRTLAEGDVLSYRCTAPGVQLGNGQNSLTLRTQTGSVVSGVSETVCADLFAPPRVCLTFLEPRSASVLAAAVTTVVGRVEPREASVRLTHGPVSQPASPDSSGAFRLPVTLDPGFNTLRLDAQLGPTVVSVAHSVTFQAPTTSSPLFIRILSPLPGAFVSGTTVPVSGQTNPGAGVAVSGPGTRSWRWSRRTAAGPRASRASRPVRRP